MFHVFKLTKDFRQILWAAVKRDCILSLLPVVQISILNRIQRGLTTIAIAFGGILFNLDLEDREALTKLLGSRKCFIFTV